MEKYLLWKNRGIQTINQYMNKNLEANFTEYKMQPNKL